MMRALFAACVVTVLCGCSPCQDIAEREESYTLAIEQCQQTQGCVVTLGDMRVQHQMRMRVMECKVSEIR